MIKKLLSITILSLLMLSSAMSQVKDPKAIYDRYCTVIGVTKQSQSVESKSAMMEMIINVGISKMEVKVISKTPNLYRADMVIKGDNIKVVGNDKVAYVTSKGKTQKVTDKNQIKQMLPITDITKELVPKLSPQSTLTYKGTSAGCDIVELVSEEGVAEIHYNIKTGYIDKVVTTAQGQSVVVRYRDYKKFGNSKLLIPSKIVTDAVGKRISIEILNFEPNHPVEDSMFLTP